VGEGPQVESSVWPEAVLEIPRLALLRLQRSLTGAAARLSGRSIAEGLNFRSIAHHDESGARVGIERDQHRIDRQIQIVDGLHEISLGVEHLDAAAGSGAGNRLPDQEQ